MLTKQWTVDSMKLNADESKASLNQHYLLFLDLHHAIVTQGERRAKLPNFMSILPSPTVSIYPAVCRICHSSEASIPYNGNVPGEPLISPCNCKGTMGLYHRSCLERWLTTSRTTCCEICKFSFQIKYINHLFINYQRAKCPLKRSKKIGCIMLCYVGVYQQTKGFTEWKIDTLGLIMLGIMLSFTYVIWFLVTISFHLKVYFEWRKGHEKMFVVDQLSEQESFLINGRHRNSDKAQSRLPFLMSSLNCTYCMRTPMVSTTRSIAADNQQMTAADNAALIDVIVATPENNADNGEIDNIERASSQGHYEEIDAVVLNNEAQTVSEQDWDETVVGGIAMSTSSACFMASTPLQMGTVAKMPLFNFNTTCSTLKENDDSEPHTSYL
ncbi:E3 ubiquitin-protein ligase MARCH2 [Toxocara canis]|uniref:E3 ubiquitin-protein ligase MARCH2 n=1 Tax=Toxocara canis TaxID=6265 RepID=A0A0B2UT47_TOXCA|nr:E3 ubiquitin-protein ligase MARCH2 [Toxocara canis]